MKAIIFLALMVLSMTVCNSQAVLKLHIDSTEITLGDPVLPNDAFLAVTKLIDAYGFTAEELGFEIIEQDCNHMSLEGGDLQIYPVSNDVGGTEVQWFFRPSTQIGNTNTNYRPIYIDIGVPSVINPDEYKAGIFIYKE